MESDSSQALITEKLVSYHPSVTEEQRMDLDDALRRMKNPRYREVIQALDLEDRQPEVVAEQLSITVANLYNLHRRALIQLRALLGRKENFYDE